jgi:serine/threonine-protein kinase
MSPEQIQDRGLTPQTDLYSLGVVLYELLTGYPPFRAEVLGSLVQKILHEEPRSVQELRPEIPDSLAAVVARALEKSTEKRFQDGAEFAAALSAVFGDLETAPPEIEMSDAERFAALRELHFFNDFSDAEIEEVLDVAVWVRFPGGETIIREGAVEQAFYVLVNGEAGVSIGGKQISTLSKGECIGEIGYLTPVRRIATVKAAGDALAIKIDSSIMEWASISAQMRFNKAFQQTLIERLSRTTAELAKHLS